MWRFNKDDEASVFMLGLSRLKEEVTLCQFLHEVKVRAAALAAAPAAVRAGEEAAAAVFARAPAASVSVRPAATRRPISREFPALKSNVPNAGP
jgi:Tfp pilus assembly protein FimV